MVAIKKFLLAGAAIFGVARALPWYPNTTEPTVTVLPHPHSSDSHLVERQGGSRSQMRWSTSASQISFVMGIVANPSLPPEINAMINEYMGGVVRNSFRDWLAGLQDLYPGSLDALDMMEWAPVVGRHAVEGNFGFNLWFNTDGVIPPLADLWYAMQDWCTQSGGRVQASEVFESLFNPPAARKRGELEGRQSCPGGADILQYANLDVNQPYNDPDFSWIQC